MITHFAGLRLHTVSIPGVKQFYRDILGFPIVMEAEGEIRFRPTDSFELAFEESEEPIAPVHFAFEVPFSAFDDIANKLRRTVPLLSWEDGTTLNRFETGKNVYFRDGDGHLLELIAHSDGREQGRQAFGKLQVLYLREVGLPFEPERLNGAREWMKRVLSLQSVMEDERFGFMVGGTAYSVVVSTARRWVPISMIALKPNIEIAYGIDGQDHLELIRSELIRENQLLDTDGNKLTFNLFGYTVHLVAGSNRIVSRPLNEY
jgi:Predicted ring-cleavage extradiol dioxygenase